MNTNMSVTIRHLTNTFILLFLVLSGVAAYVQIGNAAPFNGPTLAGGSYETRQRQCPPVDKPVRGTIYDRSGKPENRIAWTEPDPTYICGYKRVYAQWVIDDGLAPLIGYSTYNRGNAGVENTYDDYLSGNKLLGTPNPSYPIQSAYNKLIHQPQNGSDLYLTIDRTVQDAANKYYDISAEHGGGACSPVRNPAGSITVENPANGDILAMVSKAAPQNPNLDLNAIAKVDSTDPDVKAQGEAYFSELLNDPGARLLNRAAQGQYAPGSTFKTVTMTAALDSGKYSLNDARFSETEAKSYTVQGHTFNWDDFSSYAGVARFPMDLEHGYAYSDNVIYGRVGVDVGADTWLHYVGLFGIQTPGHDWNQNLGFDAPFAQSSAYPATQNGQAYNFDNVALAASAFGQGSLFISPLTMSVVVSTIASDGVLRKPHVGLALAPHNTAMDQGTQVRDPGTDQQIIQPGTAQNVRKAMWAVSNYGTGSYGNGQDPVFGGMIKDSGTFMGGKTGTAQVAEGQRPGAWWISLSPDDQAPGARGGAQYTIIVNKEGGAGSGNNEGACQVYVANDIYRTILKH